MSSMSNLALGRAPPVRVSHDRGRVPVPDEQPAPAAAPPRGEELTVDAARALSIDTVNLLVRENPGLVARLVIDAGKRRRAELPMSRSELRPAALAVILCGAKRRAEPLTEADEQFLAGYLAEIDAS